MFDFYTVGTEVLTFTIQRCEKCKTWFKYSYDDATSEIKNHGYFNVVCPRCEKEYNYNKQRKLPKEYLIFKETV
jgi:RNase P subunit RPR2